MYGQKLYRGFESPPLRQQPAHRRLPLLVHRIEETLDIRIQHVVHFLSADSDHQRIQRVVLAAPGTEPVREAEKILFVHGAHDRGHRALDELVFQRRDCERPQASIRFGDVRPLRGQSPIGAPLHLMVQDREVALQVRLVAVPRQPVHAGRRIPLGREKRLPQ